jgi:ADP-heptose:LPS heptosyltransferase
MARTARPRILLIRRRYLGDVVLLGSALRNLRLFWPDAHLTVLTEHAYSGALPLNPDINGALRFPRRIGEWFGFIRALRRARFTHVLDFDNSDKTALVTRITAARVRATFDREKNTLRHGHCYTHRAKVSAAFYSSNHITETNLALLAAIGVPTPSREVSLKPHPEDVTAMGRLFYGSGFKVLIHPGSRSPHRIWPLENFAKVSDRLQDELDAQVFLTAGPREKPLIEGIRSGANTHIMVPDTPRTIGELAALISRCDVLLCHDSGPMHIAAAVGTPVVALFGSQPTAMWRPLGSGHSVLQTILPCACLGAEAPTPCVREDAYRSYCVRLISEYEVFDAVAALRSARDS